MAYLTGERLETSPFLKILSNGPAGTIPEEIPIAPPLSSAAVRVRFAPNKLVFAVETNGRREEIQGLGHPDFGIANSDSSQPGSIWAPDESFVMFKSNPVLLMKAGPYYVPHTGFPAVTGVLNGAMTEQAELIFLRLSAAPNEIRIYTKTGTGEGATWTVTGTFNGSFPPGAPGNGSMRVSPDANYIWFPFVQAQTAVFFRDPVSGDYAAVPVAADPADPAGPGLDPAYLLDAQPLPDGRLGAAFYYGWNYGFPNVHKWARIHVFDGTSVTINSSGRILDISATNGPYADVVCYAAPDAPVFAFTGCYELSVNMGAIYRWNGTEYAQAAQWTLSGGAAAPPVGVTGAISRYGLQFARFEQNGNSSPGTVSLLQASEASPFTYVQHDLVGVNMIHPRAAGFSPDGNYLHMAPANAAIRHWRTGSPYTETTIPGVPNPIYSVAYSPNGGTMLVTETLGGAVQGFTKSGGAGSGLRLDYRTLSGVFVTLYDLDAEGDSPIFREREFVMHPPNTIISDYVFSDMARTFLYHVRGTGRHVYDIMEKDDVKPFRLMGVEAEPDDEASFAAVSPHETHFVVTYKNELGSNVRLYLLSVVDDVRTYEEKDTDLVAFGPPAFSACDTVLVAHGGEEPYTLYMHDRPTETLIEAEIGFTNWTDRSEIIFAIFSQDCQSVVVVSEEGGMTEIDGDGDVETNEPSSPGPDGPEKQNNEDGGSTISNGSGGDGGAWNFPPDGGVSSIVYLPYVTVSFSFRTW